MQRKKYNSKPSLKNTVEIMTKVMDLESNFEMSKQIELMLCTKKMSKLIKLESTEVLQRKGQTQKICSGIINRK